MFIEFIAKFSKTIQYSKKPIVMKMNDYLVFKKVSMRKTFISTAVFTAVILASRKLVDPFLQSKFSLLLVVK